MISSLRRQKILDTLNSNKYQIVIIGSSVCGAFLAYEIAKKGFKVVLVEKDDFANGVSDRNESLLYGFKEEMLYLNPRMLYFSLSALSKIKKIVPNLIIPRQVQVPIFSFSPINAAQLRFTLQYHRKIGKNLYNKDFLQVDKESSKTRLYSKSWLQSVCYMREYFIDNVRCVIELLKMADSHGADIINYVDINGYNYTPKGTLKIINCRDRFTQKKVAIQGDIFINATGLPIQSIRRPTQNIKQQRYVYQRVVHFVFNTDVLPLENDVLFYAPDGKIITMTPYKKLTVVKVKSERQYDTPQSQKGVFKREAQYVIDVLNVALSNFNGSLTKIHNAWTDYNIIPKPQLSESKLGMLRNNIMISSSSIMSIMSKKTLYCVDIAEKTIETILKRNPYIELTTPKKGSESLMIKPEKPITINTIKHIFEQYKKISNDDTMGIFYIQYLVRAYGVANTLKIFKLLNNDKQKNVMGRLLKAELNYGLLYEGINMTTDFWFRRIGYVYLDIDYIEKYKEFILQEMKTLLKWTDHRVNMERLLVNEACNERKLFKESFFK